MWNIIDNDGQVLSRFSVEEDARSNTKHGQECLWLDFPADWVEHGVGYLKPAPPSPAHTFNYTTKQWEDPRTLADLKDQKWSELKAARDSFEFGSFVSGDHEFDSNQISQQRIGQAAQGAMFAISVGAPFTQDWTLKDNSVATFDAQQMIGVALAMGQHIGYAHTHSRQLRAAIDAATTAEEVEAINW